MRIINIFCNGNLASKDLSTIYEREDYCLKNHYEFKICFVEVKKDGKNDIISLILLLLCVVFILIIMFCEARYRFDKKYELVETLVNKNYDYDIHLLLGDF